MRCLTSTTTLGTAFSIRILPREVPFDGSLFGVSDVLPSIDFGLQKLATDNASIQTLPAEEANFDLGHVQPTAVLGHALA